MMNCKAWTSHEPDPWSTQRVNKFTPTVMPAIAYSSCYTYTIRNKTILTCSCKYSHCGLHNSALCCCKDRWELWYSQVQNVRINCFLNTFSGSGVLQKRCLHQETDITQIIRTNCLNIGSNGTV